MSEASVERLKDLLAGINSNCVCCVSDSDDSCYQGPMLLNRTSTKGIPCSLDALPVLGSKGKYPESSSTAFPGPVLDNHFHCSCLFLEAMTKSHPSSGRGDTLQLRHDKAMQKKNVR